MFERGSHRITVAVQSAYGRSRAERNVRAVQRRPLSTASPLRAGKGEGSQVRLHSDVQVLLQHPDPEGFRAENTYHFPLAGPAPCVGLPLLVDSASHSSLGRTVRRRATAESIGANSAVKASNIGSTGFLCSATASLDSRVLCARLWSTGSLAPIAGARSLQRKHHAVHCNRTESSTHGTYCGRARVHVEYTVAQVFVHARRERPPVALLCCEPACDRLPLRDRHAVHRDCRRHGRRSAAAQHRALLL